MNGMVENLNRVKKVLRKWFEKHPNYSKKDLEIILETITNKYNNSFHSILKMSPIEYQHATVVELESIMNDGNLPIPTINEQEGNLRIGEIRKIIKNTNDRYVQATRKAEKSVNSGKSDGDFSEGERVRISSLCCTRGDIYGETWEKIATIVNISPSTLTRCENVKCISPSLLED